jgi:hypothetical protein
MNERENGDSTNGQPGAEERDAICQTKCSREPAWTSERIAAARERIEAEGGRWGCPLRMARHAVERAVALRAQGRSVRQIAIALGKPTSQRFGIRTASNGPHQD